MNFKEHRILMGIQSNKSSNSIPGNLFTTQFCKFSLYLFQVLNVYKKTFYQRKEFVNLDVDWGPVCPLLFYTYDLDLLGD